MEKIQTKCGSVRNNDNDTHKHLLIQIKKFKYRLEIANIWNLYTGVKSKTRKQTNEFF